jgi:hypothetical protein
MKCWICNKGGNSGEHTVKASDLRMHFGGVSQMKPLYYHSSIKKNIPVGSINNKRFKSKALICSHCNNQRTQPFDIAWEKLHKYLSSNWKEIEKNKKIDLSKVFPGNVKRSMIDVHLFFVKIFGCRIMENLIPINIGLFSRSLMNRLSHPHVYISIGSTMGNPKSKYAGITQVSTCNINDIPIFATWFYTVGDITINVIYSTIGVEHKTISNSWHPKNIHKILKLAKYD